jgi:DNA-3-methyladenine glycosylase II
MTEQEFKKAIRYLKKADPILARVIDQVELQLRKPHSNYFQALVESIISQQLSVKAADTIEARFKALFNGKSFPKPSEVLKTSDEQMRSVGLSGSKVKYIKDLAKRVESGDLKFKGIETKSEEEIIEMLVQVKGIGQWTAEMFMMFALGRPDLYSHGDLGLRNAVIKLYKVRGELTPLKAEKIASKWRPYRTLACRYLWASLNLK